MENYKQTSIYDFLFEKFKIDKPIRLIELFSGYGSQALSLKYLGCDYKSYKTCEWAVKSIQAYKDLHFGEDNNDYSKGLTNEEIFNFLFKKGISFDYNKPATIEQIKRLGETKARTIYNNIIAIHNLVNIQQIKGEDLEIVDKHIYIYILTYSFPCQDLSIAGKMRGMEDTTTRSGMIWEVDRILNEIKDNLPQCLLMENVVQIHNKKNSAAFEKWLLKLEKLGYTNFVMDLNSKDFGVPQNRNRTFVLSLLGNYNYEKPKPFELKTKLKDLLEDNVDEKFYLTKKQINDIVYWNSYEKPLDKMEQTAKKQVSPTLTTRTWDYCAGMILIKEYAQNGVAIKNATKQGYLIANDGDGVDISGRMKTHRGTVQKGMAHTLTTQQNVGVCVENDEIKGFQKFGSYYTWENKQGNINTQCNRAADEEKYALTIACANNGNVFQHSRIRKYTPREGFRLMGVKDEDFEKIAKNQSNASLGHLAGDSIVVDVLMNIFKQLL